MESMGLQVYAMGEGEHLHLFLSTCKIFTFCPCILDSIISEHLLN